MKKFTFSYKQVRFTAAQAGKGTAIVFLHGFLENKNMWRETIQALPHSYRKIVIDLPGHGESGNLGYVHSMDEMAEVVRSMLNHLKIKKVTLCGHSMGGYVALAFAELFPDMVKGIVLLNSTARADTDERKKNRDRAINVVKRNHSSYIRQSIPMLFRPKNRRLLADEVRTVKEQALKTSKQGIIAALEGMKIRPDREVILRFAGFPVFMIAGKHDPVIAYKDSQDQIREHNLDHLLLENGHMSHIEDFDELLAGLKQMLRKATT